MWLLHEHDGRAVAGRALVLYLKANKKSENESMFCVLVGCASPLTRGDIQCPYVKTQVAIATAQSSAPGLSNFTELQRKLICLD